MWASPPQPFGRVGIAPIAPMQSAPMPKRITVQKQTLRRGRECTKVVEGAHFKINNVNKFWGKEDTPPYVPPHILGTCMDPPLHTLLSLIHI